jgi:hypothetical protein
VKEDMMEDERIGRASQLFQQAWLLLDNLEDLERQLVEPNSQASGPSTAKELRSYAVCVTNLARSLRFSLQNEVIGAHRRKDFAVRAAMLPHGANFPLLGDAWLTKLLRDSGTEAGPTAA